MTHAALVCALVDGTTSSHFVRTRQLAVPIAGEGEKKVEKEKEKEKEKAKEKE